MTKKRRAAKKSKVKHLKLTLDKVVTVAAPKGTVPVVVASPVKGIVSIIPVKEDELKQKQKSWFERVFG